MSGLENLLGGDMAKSLSGLIQQFESGNAHAVSSADVAAHHDAVAKHLSPQQYEQAAIDAASKLTPEQRLAEHQQVLDFLLEVQAAGQSHGVRCPYGWNTCLLTGINQQQCDQCRHRN